MFGYLHLVQRLLPGCDVRQDVGETLSSHFGMYGEVCKGQCRAVE